MSNFCARMLFVFLLLCATISAFGQVSLIEGKWEDIKPLPKPGTVRSATGEAILPHDPLVEYQRGLLRQIGLTGLIQEYGISVLNQPVKGPVAVIDTGVSNLKDLEGRIDPAKGRTFAVDGGDPSQDDGPHGTAVVSIGFATADNGIGITGINSSSIIISIKAVGAYTNQFGQKVLRRDDMKGLIDSLKYVPLLSEEYDLPLIVNISLAVDGIPSELQEVLDAIKKTDKVLLVTPADNFPEDLAKLKKSLCADEPNVLCVSSISGEEGQTYLSAWSAYGTAVSYTGRCHDIVAQYTEGFYGRFTGNSGCAPQVSAAASLVASYMASKGRILKASELKNLMLRGGEFDPGLISGTRPIKYPVTLNMLRLFREADSVLKNPESNLRLLSIVLQANSLKGEDGKPLREIERGVTYRVEGTGFGENTTVFLNRIPLETMVLSPNSLEFRVGEESSLISGERVLYVANQEQGRINPLLVAPILFGFNIR